MNKLDIDEKTFHAYATYVQRERGYKNNWVFVIHKVHFDKWVSKQLRAENIPQEPSQEFLDWLQEYQQNYVSNNPEQVREYRAKQSEFVAKQVQIKIKEEARRWRIMHKKQLKECPETLQDD